MFDTTMKLSSSTTIEPLESPFSDEVNDVLCFVDFPDLFQLPGSAERT